MRAIIGVDAGGTRTDVVFDSGSAAPQRWAGRGASLSIHGPVEAAERVSEAIARCTGGAALAAAAIGIAGAGDARAAERFAKAMEDRLPGTNVLVCGDTRIALRAAVPEGDGAVLIAGTGAIAYAEREGRTYTAGGYGYLLAEASSGFGIGAAAVTQLLRALEGRIASNEFTRAISEELDAHDRESVLHAVYAAENRVAVVAGLAERVVALAGAGDRQATRIVQAAALELFECAKSVLRQAELSTSGAPVAFAGSLLARNSLLSYLLETRLMNEFPALPLRKDAPDPVYGALAMARAR